MFANSLDRHLPNLFDRLKSAPALCIAILLGVVMPLVSAWVYPTYMHKMLDPVQEWTRLQELPFVFSEVLVIGLAMLRGMELRHFAAKLSRDYVIAFGLLLVGLWASTLLVSKVPLTSVTISLSVILHLLFGCSVYHLADNASRRTLDQFCAGLAGGLVALVLLTAWRFLLPPPLSQVPGGVIEWQAALPGFISLRHFGSWTGAITAIFAAFILRRKDEAEFGWHDLAFFLAMAMTIWSGTRAAVLAIGVSCAILVISNRFFPSLRVIGRLSILTGIGACFAYLLIPYGDPTFMLFSSGDGFANAEQISSGRSALWAGAYARWLEAPWFGWGSGSTFWEVKLAWPHTQPHNFVLQFLISWGIVGAAGGLWLLGRTVVAAHRRVRTVAVGWPLLAGLYALLVMASLEGMLHYPRFIMLIMALFALIFRLTEREAEAA